MDTELLKSMGKRIARRRKQLSLTQEQVAEHMGVSVQMVSNLELGKKAIRPENLVRLCSVLDVSSDYILMGKQGATERSVLTDRMETLSREDYEMIEVLVDYCANKRAEGNG